MPRTSNLRQVYYKWINFTQVLARKNGGIKIAVTQIFFNFRKWRFVTMVMRSLIQKLLAARKLTFFKFKLFSHGE